jgi:hypothetical protein
MLSSPLKRKLTNLKNLFFPLEKIPEAEFAYFHKLPHDVQVHWKRDGKFIIGNIIIGQDSYPTQGKSAKEFVEMVNDVIYSVYNIPPQYSGIKEYAPTTQQFKELNNAAVVKSQMGMVKQSA